MQVEQVYKAGEALTQAVNILANYVARDKEKPISKTYLTDIAREHAVDFSRSDRYGIDQQNREEYCKPITINFNRTADILNIKGLDILEIGAGQIDNHESYLSKKIPHTLWTFSDLIPLTNLPSSEAYLQLDLISTSLKIEKTFDCIIGCNVLDTLPYDKLGIAFQNIFKLLKPDGFCIHFADQPFLGNSFFQAVSDMADADSVFLPASQRLNSIYKIAKSDFHRILNEGDIWPAELYLFRCWGDQKSYLQVLSAWNFSSIEISGREHLIKRIKTVFSSYLKEIIVDEIFGSSLVRAATINGLNVDTCTYGQCTVEEQLTNDQSDNYFISTQKQQYSYKSYVLKPGIMLRTAQAHVFLALKNPNHFQADTFKEDLKGDFV